MKHLNWRRVFCQCFVLALLGSAIPAFGQTGRPVPQLAALDNLMQQALARYNVVGGSFAVVKDGHLMFARGYGLAGVEGRLRRPQLIPSSNP